MNISEKRKLAFEAFQAEVEKDMENAKRYKARSDDDAKNASHAMESRYDTFREEAEALAGGHEKQMADLIDTRRMLQRIKSDCLIVREKIFAGALVTLSGDQKNLNRYFLIPGGGGKQITVAGIEYTCVSPQTLIGKELSGKEIGDEITICVGGARRALEVLEVL